MRIAQLGLRLLSDTMALMLLDQKASGRGASGCELHVFHFLFGSCAVFQSRNLFFVPFCSPLQRLSSDFFISPLLVRRHLQSEIKRTNVRHPEDSSTVSGSQCHCIVNLRAFNDLYRSSYCNGLNIFFLEAVSLMTCDFVYAGTQASFVNMSGWCNMV